MISYEIPESIVSSKKRLTVQSGLLPNNFVIIISEDEKPSVSIIVKEEEFLKIR